MTQFRAVAFCSAVNLHPRVSIATTQSPTEDKSGRLYTTSLAAESRAVVLKDPSQDPALPSAPSPSESESAPCVFLLKEWSGPIFWGPLDYLQIDLQLILHLINVSIHGQKLIKLKSGPPIQVQNLSK